MIGMARVRRRRNGEPEEGAAAVEFALLFPIFAILTFGAISAAFVLWHMVAASQGVRDAARYGATLVISTAKPPPSGELSVSEWKTALVKVAAREAGFSDKNSDGVIDHADLADDEGVLCVAFVKGTAATHAQSTSSRTLDGSGGTTSDSPEPCIADDEAPDTANRVQVVVSRREEFNAIVYWLTFHPQQSSVQPYERKVK
jgi:Flp pilus assembly pilin Flp